MKFRIIPIVLALCFGFAPLDAKDFTSVDRDAAIDRIADLVDKNYVYADKAASIAVEIRSWKADPALASIEKEEIFASILSDRLREHDGHFSIRWRDPEDKDSAPSRLEESDESYEDRTRRDNYGFRTVKRLNGNVGYLRLNSFAWFDREAEKASPARKVGEAAMAFLEGTDAMIIDLRQNGGGAPSMVHLMYSHFVDAEPVLINKFYQREGDEIIEFYSFDQIANKRRPDTPLYVLISARTGSAAEEFAYNVQTHGRGIIVGETSVGAANPGGMFDAGDGFSIFISTGAAVNPITGTNWEHVGVQPDVEIVAHAALEKAQMLALAAIIENVESSTDFTREAKWTLERLRAPYEVKPLKASQLRRYAGSFGDLKVTVRDRKLIYKRGRRPEAPLVALGGDLFAFETTSNYRVRFDRDEKNNITGVSVLGAHGSTSSHARTE